MDEPNSNDKRKHIRAKLSEPVQFQFLDPQHLRGSLGEDISEGGIRIRLHEFVPLKTVMTLEIQLESDKVITCRGHVVWIKKERFGDRYVAGIVFEDLSADLPIDVTEAIQQFVEKGEEEDNDGRSEQGRTDGE